MEASEIIFSHIAANKLTRKYAACRVTKKPVSAQFSALKTL